MKTTLILATVLFLGVSAFAVPMPKADQELEYCAGVAKHFDVPLESVLEANQAGLPLEELPVLFTIANRAGCEYTELVQERKGNRDWLSIASEHKLGSTTFYVMISSRVASKSYQPTLAKFDHVNKTKWDEVELTDADIVDLVNLKFIYSFHDYSPFEVMAARDYGKSFVRIFHQIRVAKDKLIEDEVANRDEQK